MLTAQDWVDRLTSANSLVTLGVVAVVALTAWLFVRHVLLRAVDSAVRRTETTWDDAFVHHGAPRRLALVVPWVVVLVGIAIAPDLQGGAYEAIRRAAASLIVLQLVRALSSALSAANEVYSTLPNATDRPIKGYLQLLKLVAFIIGAVLILSIVINRNPLLLLSGIGALTAVLLLIFRDTILSLVASVQLTTNDMVNVGDWIEMPQMHADGDVIDVALHTVTVQNWDKTITRIPTHKLISEPFKNWRGMQESGGRRIKRSVPIDVTSVRFLTDADVARFSSMPLLADYMAGKRIELGLETGTHDPDAALTQGVRRLTNLGTYRAYVTAYLRARGDVHTESMTFLIRQLAPGPYGVAIELYCFTTTTVWSEYERIQADVFDHLLAALTYFDLRPSQLPTNTTTTPVAGGAAATDEG